MPRPTKWRRVYFVPGVTYFKPAGIPLRVLSEVCLTVEEAEAIRLKDAEGLQQEQGAERMNISRPTFQRVLGAARKKIADALPLEAKKANGRVDTLMEAVDLVLRVQREMCLERLQKKGYATGTLGILADYSKLSHKEVLEEYLKRRKK